MASKDSRRIPAAKAATPAELSAAIESLSRIELKKLEKAARYRICGLGRMALDRQWRDLLQETILAFYRPDGRKWKKDEVDIVRTLTEAMRSVADSWRRSFDEKEAHLEAELITTSESGRESYSLSDAPGGHWNTATDLEKRELIIDIEKFVEKRELAALIVMAMKEEMTGVEIRKELEISENDYETEMRWIHRNVRKEFMERRIR